MVVRYAPPSGEGPPTGRLWRFPVTDGGHHGAPGASSWGVVNSTSRNRPSGGASLGRGPFVALGREQPAHAIVLDSQRDHLLAIDRHRAGRRAPWLADVSALRDLDLHHPLAARVREVRREGRSVETSLRIADRLLREGDDHVRSG